MPLNVLEEYGLTYDPDRHLYFKSGFTIPSVTQILPFKGDHIPVEILRRAADRGRRVHKWIESTESYFTNGAPELLREDGPYCDAWLDFKEKTGFELARFGDLALAEQFIFHPLYQYAGSYDLVGYLRHIPGLENDLTLIDTKTSRDLSPTTSLQTAAYMQAVNLWFKKHDLPLVKHRCAAHLLRNGQGLWQSYGDHKGDFSVFLAYLNVTRWETKNGIRDLLEDPFGAPADMEVDALAARFV